MWIAIRSLIPDRVWQFVCSVLRFGKGERERGMLSRTGKVNRAEIERVRLTLTGTEMSLY